MLDVFRPLLEAARGLELSEPAAAEAELCRRFDPEGEAARELHARLRALLDEGRIADRGEPPVTWSRASKPGPATYGYSVDVVHMRGAGPRHRHPRGEIDYCIALDGSPEFDGRPPGWVVLGEQSVHVPTVRGGTMLVVYLLPDGAIELLG